MGSNGLSDLRLARSLVEHSRFELHLIYIKLSCMCLCNRNFHDSLPGIPINSWETDSFRIKEEAGHVSKLPLNLKMLRSYLFQLVLIPGHKY